MTARGLGFLVFTGLVYLAANQTRVGWLYVLAAGMLAVLLVSALLPGLWVGNALVTRRLAPAAPGEVREGDPVLVRIEARATGLFGAFFLQVRDACPYAAPGQRGLRAFFAAVARDGSAQDVPVVCWRRGSYDLPPLLVESRGLFGLFRATRTAAEGSTLLVRPWALERAESATLRPAEAAVDAGARAAGPGVDVIGTREYRPGDALRAVHWRSSARHGRLITKQFGQDPDPILWCVLDITNEFGEERDTTLEYGVKLAASLSRFAETEGWAFRLVTGDRRQPLESPSVVTEYLTTVEADTRAAGAAELLQRVQPGSGVVVVVAADPGGIGRLPVGVRCYATRFAGLPGLRAAAWAPGLRPLEWRAGEEPAVAVGRAIAAIEAGMGER